MPDGTTLVGDQQDCPGLWRYDQAAGAKRLYSSRDALRAWGAPDPKVVSCSVLNMLTTRDPLPDAPPAGAAAAEQPPAEQQPAEQPPAAGAAVPAIAGAEAPKLNVGGVPVAGTLVAGGDGTYTLVPASPGDQPGAEGAAGAAPAAPAATAPAQRLVMALGNRRLLRAA